MRSLFIVHGRNTRQSVVLRMRLDRVMADESIDAKDQDIFHRRVTPWTARSASHARRSAGGKPSALEMSAPNSNCRPSTLRRDIARAARPACQRNTAAPAAASGTACGCVTGSERSIAPTVSPRLGKCPRIGWRDRTNQIMRRAATAPPIDGAVARTAGRRNSCRQPDSCARLRCGAPAINAGRQRCSTRLGGYG